MNIRLDEALVSFTFDDAPLSAFESGGRLLAKYGYQGTYYISLSFHEQNSSDFFFTTEQLEIAHRQGHELACHTYGHLDISQESFTTVKEDIIYNQAKIKEQLPGYVFRNFAFPYGAQTRPVKQWLAGQFNSARGNRNGLNVGKVDLMNLKGIRLYESLNSLDLIKTYLEQAQAQKAWLVFYTHGVSQPAKIDGCSPEYFEAVLQLCKNMNLKVLTIDKALKKFS